MNSEQTDILERYYKISLDDIVLDKINNFESLFFEYNSHTNLMSKSDIQFLFEKHIFDSFAIFLYSEFKNSNLILDIGSGGGFPSLILAIAFPKINFVSVDSIAKKTNFISSCRKKLNLDNLHVITSRVENLDFFNPDIITSRAVGKISYIYEIAKKQIGKNTKFAFYKGNRDIIDKELKEFKLKYKLNITPNIISYELPTIEHHKRNLVIF